MTRHVLSEADRAKSVRKRKERSETGRMRREAEMALLNRLYAELAMPEMYPERPSTPLEKAAR